VDSKFAFIRVHLRLLLRGWSYYKHLDAITLAGSHAKGTDLRHSDVDIFLRLSPDTPGTLSAMQASLANQVLGNIRNVSVRILLEGRFIDLVPARGNILWQARFNTWLKTDVADFESYLCGPVTSYFVSQSVFEITGEWPFGEQGHETEDIAATYAEALGLKDGADHRGLLRLLTAPFLSGNPLCPCGSRKRLRDCHWKWLRERRRRIHASVRNEMARRLLKAAKE